MKVALYLRVSTVRQAEKDLSIPGQRNRLEAWCRDKGWTVAAEYVEPGASATDDKRPQFQRFSTLVKSRLRDADQKLRKGYVRQFIDLVEVGDDLITIRGSRAALAGSLRRESGGGSGQDSNCDPDDGGGVPVLYRSGGPRRIKMGTGFSPCRRRRDRNVRRGVRLFAGPNPPDRYGRNRDGAVVLRVTAFPGVAHRGTYTDIVVRGTRD